jgi:hypothetical protein
MNIYFKISQIPVYIDFTIVSIQVARIAHEENRSYYQAL